jgi:hypothetical protein
MQTEITKDTYERYVARVADAAAERQRRKSELEGLPDLLAVKLAEQIGAPENAVALYGKLPDDDAEHQDTFFVKDGRMIFVMTLSFRNKDYFSELQILAIHQGDRVALTYNGNLHVVPGAVNANNIAYSNEAASIAQALLEDLEKRL